jgi:hypothetical protein
MFICSTIIVGENAMTGRPFEPGNRGGGRVAAKNRISTKLLEALSADFEANGEMAIRRLRVDHLPDYMRLIGNLLPKEIELTATDSRLMELSDAQLEAAINYAKRMEHCEIELGSGAESKTLN